MGGGRGVTRRQLQGTFWNDGNSLHLDEGREGLLHLIKKVQEDLRSYSRGSSADQGLSKLCEGAILTLRRKGLNERRYIY